MLLNNETKVFGLEQSNHGHLYRWIFTEKSLIEKGVEPHDEDWKDILFPIGGSNSSATYFTELHTKEEVKTFLLGDYNTDYDDPTLVDIAEGIITISIEDEFYGAITSQYVKLFDIPEDELTKENSLMARARKMIEEIKACDKNCSSEIDYDSPFYGTSRDMRMSELEEIYEELTKKTATLAWKVYGEEGHRQRESFSESYKYDFSSELDGIRIIEVFNSDLTGTNEYTIVKITRNNEIECIEEFEGQVTDGIFENSRVGKYERIDADSIKLSAPLPLAE